MIRSDYQNTIIGMTLPFNIQQRLEKLRLEFAEQSRAKVDEMANMLGAEDEATTTELPQYVRVTLHEIKGQAGTFGYPLISDIARVAEKYVAGAAHFDHATVSHLNTLLNMMRNLLVETKEFDETSSSDFHTTSSAIQDCL
jgi:chemotaxis protein histidine kinase CheA